MGLFNRKKTKTTKPQKDGQVDVAQEVFDEQFRESLRQQGRQRFLEMIDAVEPDLKRDVEATMDRVTADLKEYMTKQLDVTISRVNTEITNQLNERISEFNKVSGEAQELVVQSLTRNAQLIYEKYQQMSANLQQIVASQEVMMVTVFQDNKSRVSSVQGEQEKVLKELSDSANEARRQAEQLTQALRQNISTQATRLNSIYQENMHQVTATRDAQAAHLDNLAKSVDGLQGQYQQLSELLNKSIADQKKMVTDVINDNMSRIVEHYLIGALGEQSELREQLPSILRRMEESKQDMVDDMSL